MSDEKDIHFIDKQTIKIDDFECEDGWILDIGGGGEGIIGQIKGTRVVAIDLKARELEEASGNSLKIVMDARELKFLDNTFKTATAFFSLMYIKPDDLDKIFKEVFRILEPGGNLLIWDTKFEVPPDNDKKLIGLYLDVLLPNGKSAETGYGTKMHSQSAQYFIDIAKNSGFVVSKNEKNGETFFLKFSK